MALPENTKKILAAMLLAEDTVQEKVIPTPEQLREVLATFQKNHGITVGDIVEWKPGFRSHLVPDYHEPMIVAEVHDGEGQILCLFIDDDGDVDDIKTDFRRVKEYEPVAHATDAATSAQ